MNKLIFILFFIGGISAGIYFADAQNLFSVDFESTGTQAISLNQTQLITQPLSDPWTIMAWIKLESYDGTDRQIIFYDAESGAGEDSTIQMDIAGSNKAADCRFRVNTGTEASATSEGNAIEVGRWYHIACQRNGCDVNLFVNGRLRARTTDGGMSGDINATNSFVPCIGGLVTASGCAAGTAEIFDGRIDELSFWRRALTENEIQARMRQELNAGATTTVTQGLEAYFKFDSDILSDSVGRTIQLAPTLVGTPTSSTTDTGWKQFDPDEL